MPNPNPTALEPVYGRLSSGGCQHVHWVVTVDDAALGLTVGQRLRESVVAGVGVFWRVIGANADLPSHPNVTGIDLITGSGGGGGPVTVNTTDTEYLRWEVTAPDTTLGLVVGDYVIQSIVNNVSTWRKFGSATALATAPDLTTLRPESDGGSMIEYRVVTAHGTAPSAFTAGEILWRFVSDDGSVIWRREGVKAPIATPPILSNLERVVQPGSSKVTDCKLLGSQTANPGTGWVALTSSTATEVRIYNNSGTIILLRTASTPNAVSLALPVDSEILVPCPTGNSNYWEIKRQDDNNTQVSVTFMRIAQ